MPPNKSEVQGMHEEWLAGADPPAGPRFGPALRMPGRSGLAHFYRRLLYSGSDSKTALKPKNSVFLKLKLIFASSFLNRNVHP